jgi:hypothetical protein
MNKNERIKEFSNKISNNKGVELKSLLNSTISDLICPKSLEKLKEKESIFNKHNDLLQSEVSKYGAKFEGKINSIIKQIDDMKKTKSKVSSLISESIITDNQDSDNLFQSLSEIQVKLRQYQDALAIIERQKSYPDTVACFDKGKATFKAGIDLLKACTEFAEEKESIRKKIGVIEDILKVYKSELFYLGSTANYEKDIIKAYGHYAIEQAFGTWAELETAAKSEIERSL